MRLRARAAFCGFRSTDGSNFARSDATSKRLSDPKLLLVATQIHNIKSPEAVVDSAKPLGAPGSYGAVLKTKTGVVKFDRSYTEAQLYACLPSFLKKHPILPQDVKTGSIRIPLSFKRVHGKKPGRCKLSTISREDLAGLPYIPNVKERLLSIYREMQAASANFDTRPANEVRQALKTVLVAWHKSCQKSFELTASEKKNLRTFAGGLARLVRFGIIPSDLHNDNFGTRKDGSIVIRDAGIYYVLNDRIRKVPALPEVTKAKGILKPLKRLLALKAPAPLQPIRSYILRHNAR